MANGAPVPPYFYVNQATGLISVRNSGDYLMQDVIRVVIHTRTFNENPFVQRTGEIYVVTECGPESTDISIPLLYDVQAPSNARENGLVQNSHFGSSNSLCPIFSVSLCEGATYFEFESRPGQSWESHDFEVKLNEFYISNERSYNYAVCAVALGGASASQTGMMWVTDAVYDCTGSTLRSL